MAYYNILLSGQATIEADTEEEAIEKLTDGSWETTMEVLTNLDVDKIEREEY